MTADIDDPATAQFVATGATGCALCYAPVGSDLASAQNVESCAAVSTLPADIEFCSSVALTGDAAARETACESSQAPDGGDRCVYTSAAAADARGYADHDSSSATECRACDVGEFVDSDGTVAECSDYDECQSNPCENGATCSETFASESPYPEYNQNGAFVCTWVANNLNTVDEQQVNDVSTPAECIEQCRNAAGGYTIANIDTAVLEGGSGECWCQFGDNMAEDPSESSTRPSLIHGVQICRIRWDPA